MHQSIEGHVAARANVRSITVLTAPKRDFRSAPNNGRVPTGPAGPFSARGLNRSRGRALRRAAWPWMDDGSVLPDDERARSISPEPMIVQHHDRAISHRQRWERTEHSVTTSASRIVSNTRTNAVGDAVVIYKANSKQFRWTLSRGNICSSDAVQRLPSGT
jgi:hypothetical protein